MVTSWHHFPDAEMTSHNLFSPKGHPFSANGLRLNPLRVGISGLAPDDVVTFE